MTIQDELLTILNQIPAVIEKAFTAFVERHPGHANQKTHGNRFGAGQAKESLRRLKDDKAARGSYKATARKKGQGEGLRKSLSNYEKQIRTRPFEKAVVLDRNGNVLVEKLGGRDYVEFSEREVKKMNGAILTHNHPLGHSFSPEDGYMLISGNLQEVRAVSKNYKYSLKPPRDRKLTESEYEFAYKYADSKIQGEFMPRIQSGKMTIDEANSKHHHEVWEVMKQDFGFEYSREEWQ